MSETKFTKGPWRFGQSRRPPIGEECEQERDENGNIFVGYWIAGSSENGAAILPTLAHVHNFPNNMEANAHLIAAAPELYAMVEKSARALETIAAKLDEVAQTQLADILRAGAMEQRATLAKARGES